jgi:NAD+ kinase
MAKAILFINAKKENAPVLAGEITEELEKQNIAVDSFSFERKPDFSIESGYDIAFSLGGDGTVLYAARTMAPLGVPVFPVNLGTLGFIAGVHPGEWKAIFYDWLRGKAQFSQRLMLEARVERKGREVLRGTCLNDTVVSASGIAKIIRLRVFIGPVEGEGLTYLGQYRSDGLIVATPTGSTAYSAAAGGPLLDPELEAMILNPICPFTLSHRPMVLPAGETLLIEIEEEQRSGVLLTVDGQVTEPLESGDRIFISRSPKPGILIASGRSVFYQALKTKFSWPGTPVEAPRA